MSSKKKTARALGSAYRMIKLPISGLAGAANFARKHKKTSILAASAAAYGMSPALDFSDKQRTKMMLDNIRTGREQL